MWRLVPPLLALLVACVTPAAPAAQPAPSPPAATPAATATPSPAAATRTVIPLVSAPPADVRAFGDLAAASRRATYKVTYRISGTSQGYAVASEQSWYAKPPKFRFDFSADYATVSMYLLEDGSYICTKGGPQVTCLKIAREQALGQSQSLAIEEQVVAKPEGVDSVAVGTRQIAGQPAQCFDVRPKTEGLGFVAATFCYGAQGVPLLMQSKGQDFEYSLEATAYSASVTDEDFKLPAPPTSIP